MDEAPGTDPANTVVLTGTGYEAAPALADILRGVRAEGSCGFHDADPAEYLRLPKTRKFLSKQDRLSLAAAGKALSAAKLPREIVRLSCGLFMTVGYIPFERDEAHSLSNKSGNGGRFSMDRFSTHGYASVNPIRAFACLPNMPAHHLSANFGMQGEYFITYPGTAEFYGALAEAVQRLREGSIMAALVGAAADQNNFLVENHYRKTFPAGIIRVADAAAFLVMELESNALARGAELLVKLVSLSTAPSSASAVPKGKNSLFELGPVDLPLRLALAADHASGPLKHDWISRYHVYESRWDFL